jgi:outer membrane receptor for ferrienterochelin and colicins
MRDRFVGHLIVALAAAAALALPLRAQQGTLIGRVTSERGAAVPSAGIVVLGVTTGGSALTNDEGVYRLSLPAGSYDLVVRSIGSRELRVDDVNVVAGQTTTLDIVLPSRAEELDPIQVTASRGVQERQTQTVATVHNVSALEIAERPVTTLSDHLRNAPGVDIITQGLQSTNVVVRGFNNIFSGALHMLTDHRLAGVPSLRVNLMHFVPTGEQDVDRMEVVLGPGSALYGPNTANGVVHILTKSPIDAPGTSVTLGSGYRTIGRTQGVFNPPDGQGLFQGSFRSAWAWNDEFGIKVSGQYLSGDEWPYVDPTEEAARLQALNDRPTCVADKVVRGLSTVEANAVCDRVGIRDFGIERWGGEVRADWRFADDGALIATYGRTDATGIELTGLGAGQTNNWVYQFYQARMNKGRWFAQAYYNTSDAGDTYLLQSGMPLVDQSGLFVGQLQHGFALGDGRQDFTYGFDYFGTRPKTQGTINGMYENDDNMNEWGVYLQSKTALTEQLDLVLAGRMDDHSVLADQVWSPRAALVFTPVEEHSIRLSYNRAFSTPSSLNYFLDISAGLAPSPLGLLGYGLRAYGTGPDGWSLQPGGATQIRTPCTGGAPGAPINPPDASVLWPCLAAIVQAQGGPDISGIPAPNSTQVAWMLFDPSTSSLQPLIGATLGSVSPIQESYTETFELGWTGLLQNRVKISADVYYMKKNDFVSPLLIQTPLMTLNGQQLAAYLANYMPAANAAALASVLAGVPLGVVASSEVQGSQTPELIVTYRNVGDIDLWGGDIALQWFLTDSWTLSGNYSHVSDDFFQIEDGDPIALNAPRHKGSVDLAYRNLRAGFTGAARVRFNSEFPAESAGYVGTACVTNEPLGLFDEECVEAATIMDLNFSYRVPTTDATVKLVVNNVFNTAHRSFVGVPAVRRMGLLSVTYNLF